MRLLSIGIAACFVGLSCLGACSSDSTTTPATSTGDGGGSTGDGGGTKNDSSSGGDTGTTETTCKPGDVSSFTPRWKPPTPFSQGLCTTNQVDILVECLFGNRGPNCDAIEENPDNDACEACLFTEVAAPAWGPIIFLDEETGIVNEGGCVGNAMNETAAGGCGAKVAAASDCATAACTEEACPGNDSAALAEYDACIEEANGAGCATHYEASACADAAIDTGGVAEKCYEGDDFTAWAKAVGVLFCGGTKADAATDAPPG